MSVGKPAPRIVATLVDGAGENYGGRMVETGRQGLLYLTDGTCAGLFVAAAGWDVLARVEREARACLARQGAGDVFGHIVMVHQSGALMTAPEPEWMTPAQRDETVQRMTRHIRTRLLS